MKLDEQDTVEGEVDFVEEQETEQIPVKPWVKVLIFMGMLLVSAVICAVIWHFTHLDEASGGKSMMTEISGTEGGQGEEYKVTSQVTAEPTAAPTPEITATPVPTATPEVTSTPEATSTPAVTSTPAATQAPSKEPGAEGMVFVEVQELVTPKDVINLRSAPSTLDDANIVTQIRNGEQLTRIGVNADTGWSQISYNGQILYGVSQYLSTDLAYKTPTQTADPNRISTMDGRVIVFVDCDDWISPKEYVNLRTEPSTSEGENTVSCQLHYGEKVHRTGYSADSGWSRVEYNGQVLYVVSSYMLEVEE